MSEEQTIEREARLLGKEVRTWRVRFRDLSVTLSASQSIWTDAYTPEGAAESIARWADATCRWVEVLTVEEQER